MKPFNTTEIDFWLCRVRRVRYGTADPSAYLIVAGVVVARFTGPDSLANAVLWGCMTNLIDDDELDQYRREAA